MPRSEAVKNPLPRMPRKPLERREDTMSSTLQAIEISPVTPAFGARVDGLNAREPLDEDVVRELKDAIAKYKVLFLTAQNLDEQQHARLAAYFGAPHQTSNRFDVEYEESGLTDVKVVSHFHSDLDFSSGIADIRTVITARSERPREFVEGL